MIFRDCSNKFELPENESSHDFITEENISILPKSGDEVKLTNFSDQVTSKMTMNPILKELEDQFGDYEIMTSDSNFVTSSSSADSKTTSYASASVEKFEEISTSGSDLLTSSSNTQNYENRPNSSRCTIIPGKLSLRNLAGATVKMNKKVEQTALSLEKLSNTIGLILEKMDRLEDKIQESNDQSDDLKIMVSMLGEQFNNYQKGQLAKNARNNNNFYKGPKGRRRNHGRRRDYGH